MLRFLIIATLLSTGFRAVSHTQTARAQTPQPDCRFWNSPDFFMSATAADVRRCLAAGADVNAPDASGWTPLHWATAYGTAEAVAALVDAGAKVDAREASGGTPLHLAVGQGVFDEVAALIQKPGEKPPSDFRPRQGVIEKVAALIKAGADMEARTKSGLTPLHMAAAWGTAETVAALVDAGAEVNPGPMLMQKPGMV
ncbi:MAG: ankyrin repeat domain-containing protein [Hyphomonadaceae bacterium]|nr:ankyrin repeat domain-containing protein [Hyphomonadaceae bacterium]